MPTLQSAQEVEYQAAVRGSALVARMLAQYDIPQLLEAIERADSFGCFIDPTLWQQKRKAMNEDRELLEAALKLWQWAKKHPVVVPADVETQPQVE
jgi:hypothetical protein